MLGVIDRVANTIRGAPVDSRISITTAITAAPATAADTVTTSRKVLTTIVFCGMRKRRWHFHDISSNTSFVVVIVVGYGGGGGGVVLSLTLCVCVCVCSLLTVDHYAIAD